MKKKEHIVSHRAEELRAMRTRGESKTDWTKAAVVTDAELEASIAADPDEAGIAVDWAKASPHMPQPKVVLNMRDDAKS